MKCPHCKAVDLMMSERSGVEIDYCPTCRGVWLDRGELDKILERAGREGGAPAAAGPVGPVSGPGSPQPGPVFWPPPHHRHGENDDSKYGYTYHDPKKRKNWLRELFD